MMVLFDKNKLLTTSFVSNVLQANVINCKIMNNKTMTLQEKTIKDRENYIKLCKQYGDEPWHSTADWYAHKRFIEEKLK